MNMMLHKDETLEVGFIVICQDELTQTWAFPLHIAQGLFRRLSGLKLDSDFAPEYDTILEEHEHFAHHTDTRRMDAKLTANERWNSIADEIEAEVLGLADRED